MAPRASQKTRQRIISLLQTLKTKALRKGSVITAAILCAVLLTYHLLPKERWASQYAKTLLANKGIAPAEFTLRSIGITGLKIEELTLGDDLTVSKLSISYSPWSLLWGRVGAIDIDQARWYWYTGAAPLGSLQALVPESDGKPSADFPALPFKELVIRDSVITGKDGTKTHKTAMAPVTINAELYAGRRPEIALELRSNAYPVELNLEAAYNPTTGDGYFTLALPRIDFATGKLQPDQLAPLLRRTLHSVEGGIGAGGTVIWHNHQVVESDLSLTLDRLAAVVQGIRVKDINAEIAIDNVWPFATGKLQHITIGHMSSGIPLSQGNITFDMANNSELNVHSSKWQWGQGSVATNAIALDLAAFTSNTFVLNIKDVELSDIVPLDKESLTVTGSLSGKIPVRFDDKSCVIQKGYLKTNAPGVVRYIPKEAAAASLRSNPTVAMVFDIVKDLHYQTIGAELASPDCLNAEVKLLLSGKNPAMYNGREVKLNLNVSGNLLDMFRQSADVFSLPENIIRGIQP